MAKGNGETATVIIPCHSMQESPCCKCDKHPRNGGESFPGCIDDPCPKLNSFKMATLGHYGTGVSNFDVPVSGNRRLGGAPPAL